MISCIAICFPLFADHLHLLLIVDEGLVAVVVAEEQMMDAVDGEEEAVSMCSQAVPRFSVEGLHLPATLSNLICLLAEQLM